MKLPVAILVAGILAAALARSESFPAPDWRERADPDASPLAVKGGLLRLNGGSAPKSVNAYIDNNAYTRMMFDLLYATLLSTDVETLDFAPLLAERWSVSEDGREFTFTLDPAARWSDGVPITAEDVCWTFAAVMAPTADTGAWKSVLGGFDPPQAVDARTVVFRKHGESERDWRDLLHVGMFPILPAHAFRGRDFDKLDFKVAPVSGPYRLAELNEQVSAGYRRVENWWRGNRVSERGKYNFERIVLKFYAENENAYEALKQRQLDVYPVYSARIMNLETHGEKFERNWLLKRRVRNFKPIGFQGFAMNARRPPFDDLRVRQAMAQLLDRETMNRTMMAGEYFLIDSYYPDLYDAAHPCRNPHYGYDPAAARRLLAEAGLTNGFTFTFLSRSATEDKFLMPFARSLAECGITMKIERQDFAAWMRTMDEYAFDMTWAAWGAGIFREPGPMWSSAEADRRGGNNLTGFKSAAADELIRRERTFLRMADRLDAYRRLDALVAAEVPYVLLWMTDETRLIYWNRFSMPEHCLGRYGDEESVLAYWWYDADKDRELNRAMAEGRFLPAVAERVGPNADE